MLEKQKTILKKISLKGFGLYTNKKITVTLIPAPVHTGFLFKRIDLEEKPSIKVSFFYLDNFIKDRGIVLNNKKIRIYSIENIVSAFVGMDLDNIIVELNGDEVPFFDGSSKIFVEAIESVGIIEQNANREFFSVKKTILIENKKTDSEIIVIPYKRLGIKIGIDFQSKNINSQNASFYEFNQFKNISVSKNFCDISEKNYEKNKKNSDLNELAKHSLLNVIGFLSLIEMKLKGKIIVQNPNYHILKKLIELFIKEIRILKKLNKKEYNIEKKPIFDIKKIMNILPHKPPFLLVDKIIDISEDYVIGIKNVTINESFFLGHFPNEPIMPGVLQIEAIAQVGGVLILSKIKNPNLYSTYFFKIDKVVFNKKILPGDTIVFQVCLLNPIKRGIVQMIGRGYVNKNLSVEAEVIAKIVKKQ